MAEQQYKVFMQTPLGRKYGTMTAQKTGNRLNGTLSLLNHTQPFEGIIDESGNCQIKGTFVTLLRTVSYIADGKINKSNVSLHMQGGRNQFELSGTACPHRKDLL